MERRTLKRSLKGFALSALLLAANAGANTFYFQIDPQTADRYHQVLILGPAAATGTVTGASGFSQTFDLGAAGRAVVDVPADVLSPGTVENKGFSITSAAELQAYFLNQAEYTQEMLHLIPSDKLGTEYLVAGYHNIRNDQISVQATQDGTTVTIAPKGAAAVNLSLNAGQTYLYSADAELTGSSVTADKPVAVQSGNACAYVPFDFYITCDLLDEQIPSIDTLSTSYLVPMIDRGSSYGLVDVMRVVATANNTEVSINGITVAILNKGDYYQGNVAEGEQVNATHPVLVVEYLRGYNKLREPTNGGPDPGMTVIPGADQWLSSYDNVLPPRSDVQFIFRESAGTVVIPTDALPSLRSAGMAVDPHTFKPIGSTGYSYGRVLAAPVTADKPFEFLWHGRSLGSSFFTYGGSTYGHGTALPLPQTPAPVSKPPNAAGNNPAADATSLYFQREFTGPSRLVLLGPGGATGTLGSAGSSAPLPFQLDGNGYAAVDLPATDGLTAGRVENKGWWVSSDQALKGFIGAERLMSGDSLGTSYVIPAYRDSYNSLDPLEHEVHDDWISVQALRDDTTVTIAPHGSGGYNRVTLNAGQSYFYQAADILRGRGRDLTGTFVTADKPIAVDSGNTCARIPTTANVCGGIGAQIPPVDALSSRYVLPQTPHTGSDGNVVRVVATVDNTGVTINGAAVATLNRGEYYEGRVAGGETVDANQPVLVAEYLARSTGATADYLPAMTVVPGVDRWQNSYSFSSSFLGTAPDSAYAVIVIGTASLPSLRVAGQAVDPAAFAPIGSSGYSFGSVDISASQGAATAVADTPFELLLWRPGGLTYAGASFPAASAAPPAPANVPPQCNDDSARVRAGGAANLPVLSNDSAPEGGRLTVVSVTSPTEHGGTVSINGDGSVSYVPPNGYTGPDSFSYTAKDSQGATGSAQVRLTVTSASGQGEPNPAAPPPDAPDAPGSAPGQVATAHHGGGGILDLDGLLWLLVMAYWRGRVNQALESLRDRPLP